MKAVFLGENLTNPFRIYNENTIKEIEALTDIERKVYKKVTLSKAPRSLPMWR